MDIHCAAISEIIEAPHLVQQLVAGVDPVGCGRQMVEKLQFLGRRVHLFSVHNQLVGVQVNRELIKGQPLTGVVGNLRSPQYGIDPGNQLLHFKGLYNIVVSSHLQALNTVKNLTLGSQHDDRHLAGLPDFRCDRPAIHDRQHNVQQNQIRNFLLELFNRFPAIAGDADVESLLHQIHLNQIRDIAIILYHQNITAHGVPSQYCMFMVVLYLLSPCGC